MKPENKNKHSYPSEIEIRPSGPVDAQVAVPGSKSYTNRALAAAALADGRSIITNPLRSDDTVYMSRALNTLGITVEELQEGSIGVEGCSGKIPAASAELFVGNAGTAMRFLTALLTLGAGNYTIDGNERMRERPIQDLLDGLRQIGGTAQSVHRNGCPPVQIAASGLRGGRVVMPGQKSSQYFSALMLAAPYARNDVEIVAEGALVSKPYLDMTIEVMRAFGARAERIGNTMRVQAGTHYRGCRYTVEADASAASYFFAAAAVTGGKVRVSGLSTKSLQGDVQFAAALARMGCTVSEGETGDAPYIEVQGGTLEGIEIDMGDMSDVSLTLAVVAAFAQSPTRIYNVANMRIKETDRIAALATELQKMGQKVDEFEDGLTIYPQPIQPARIHTYDDHRMAMSFAIAGLAAPGIVITNPACVSKTFPDFFERLHALKR